MKFLQKVEDFFRGQKDKSEILCNRNFQYGKKYIWDGIKFIKGDFTHDNFTKDENIKWIESNSPKFFIKNLGEFGRYGVEAIKPEIFFKDISEISALEKLQILGAEIDFDDVRNIYVKLWFREEGFQNGDDMPHDILEYFINEIKNGLKKKSNFYLKNYNILSSRRGPQKMKYRTSPLYTIRPRSQFKFDLKKGIFNIEVAVNFN